MALMFGFVGVLSSSFYCLRGLPSFLVVHVLNLILCFYLHLFGAWQKVVQISCGWRHTLAVTERQNVFSWGRGTNGQLGHGESMDR